MIQLKNYREIDMIRKSGKVLAECLLSLDEVISEIDDVNEDYLN